MSRQEAFRRDIAHTINVHSAESGSNTPDFVLAEFLEGCLEAFDKTTRERDRWYGVKLAPCGDGGGAMSIALSGILSGTEMGDCKDLAASLLLSLEKLGWKLVRCEPPTEADETPAQSDR